MKTVLFTIIVVIFIAMAIPTFADRGEIYLLDGKGGQQIEFNYQTTREVVTIIKGVKNGQARMGRVCSLEDIGFVNNGTKLRITISCRPLFQKWYK